MSIEYKKRRRQYTYKLKIEILKEYIAEKEKKSSDINTTELMQNYANQVNIPFKTLENWYYDREKILSCQQNEHI
jgi:hypothetical protein